MIFFTVFTMCAYYITDAGTINIKAISAEKEYNEFVTNEKDTDNKDNSYIVKTKKFNTLHLLQKRYTESGEIGSDSEGNFEENKMLSIELSQKQVNDLRENEDVEYVERDYDVAACSQFLQKKRHRKQVEKFEINDSEYEWNVRMLRAEGKRANTKEHVKIAVIDSGIDWGNDIDLAHQVSLVPGEEEMTQVFMDGSGHGSSVASLIAASENEKGITGINPYVDIYSYRVLDENNRSPLSRVVEAIYMAVDQGVNIINMSFGLSAYSETLEQAIHTAEENGILMIAAAGNTGDEGVLYPAAFDGVMAVGAVDKNGTIEEYSAKGKEVEIVAPGELVKTTGFLGSEDVISGTSLAAPQVAAVASLIWQKDLTVSADFVRGLLDESANLYGKCDLYGYGLVDAKYALQHYNEYKRKYNEKAGDDKNILDSVNRSSVITFEDTGCVEGNWMGNDHAALVDSAKYCVRAGARFPDTTKDTGLKISYFEDGQFNHMTLNPWWHGYYETNYIKAVLYASYKADAIGSGLGYNVQYPSLHYANTAKMDEDIAFLYAKNQRGWREILKYVNNHGGPNQTNTNGFKRAILWGMAIHSATDTYAHSSALHGNRITHGNNYSSTVADADNKNYITWRYRDAAFVANKIMEKYNNRSSLSASDLMMSGNCTIGYELIKFNEYIKTVDSSLNYSYHYKTK